MAQPTAFEKQSARLFNATKILPSSSSLSISTNKILTAQRNATIYQENVLVADPLRKTKEHREATLGRGWFDLKVVLSS